MRSGISSRHPEAGLGHVPDVRAAGGLGSGPGGRRLRPLVLLFFLASGATGLVLEVVWTRCLGTVFGNTVYAASTVLTVFLLGLALGSAVLGRLADRTRRPLALYGCLEIGVGLCALGLPLLAAGSLALYRGFYRLAGPGFALLTAVRLVLSAAMILPPTFLMGGTLPVLARHLGARHERPGREVGYLYAANTLGAVAGCFLAGFVLLERLGVRGTLYLAGAVALGVGLLAVLAGCLTRSAGAAPAARRPEEAPAPPARALSTGAFRLILVAFAVTGFCALAYEVLWTRVLIFALRTSVYSFATMLTTFLVGLAIGSFVSARFLVPRLRRPILWFGVIEVLVALAALASVPLLARLNLIDLTLARRLLWSGRWQFLLTRFADAFVVLLVPTLLMGAAFPIVTTGCLDRAAPIGRRVGQLYAANTTGCVAGAFAAGFVLLPAAGTQRSLLIVVSLNLAVGVALLWHATRRSLRARIAWALPAAGAALAAFVFTPADAFHDTINMHYRPAKLAFLAEHPTGTVAVHDLPSGERLLSVCGVDVAGCDFMLRSTQKLQGYIPLLLHARPRRVVQIGFGGGETARVGLDFGVEDYTVVEICPAVFEAGRFLEHVNRGSWRDGRIRRIIMDGKNFAHLADEKFDLVMNDSTYPGSSGSSALYTVDHFRSCRERLADGGLFSCWVPLDLRPRELRMVLRSFQQVFPHTSLWVASNCLNKHALILGSLTPLRIDLGRVAAGVSCPEVAADLREIEIHDAYDLLDCYMCGEDAIRRLVAGDPVNTDDRPRLEFRCAVPAPRERSLARVLAMLAACRTPVAPNVASFPDEARDRAELARRFRATTHIFRAQVAQLVGDPTGRQRELARALAANPGEAHVRSCRAELDREIHELRNALTAMPKSAVLAVRLAGKLYVAGRDREAGGIYEQLARDEPPVTPQVLTRLANLHFRAGRRGRAERLLCRCLGTWHDCAEAHDLLAGLYLRKGRPDLARRHIAEALRLEPHNALYQAHREAIHAAALAAGSAPQ